MQDLIAYTIFGLVTASIYAIAASGLVVTYTTSGVFNLAHGATGMFGAFLYWQLRFAWQWPAWIALLIVVGILAPLFGCVIEKVLMRNLSDATEATKLAVTIGVLVDSGRCRTVDLESADESPVPCVLRGTQGHDHRRPRHRRPADHCRHRHRVRGRPADPALPHQDRSRHAGRRRRSVPGSPERRPA